MRVAITGATGVVGRHLLFEFIKQHLGRLDELEVLVLGRQSGAEPLHDRIEGIILEDGAPYVLGEGRGTGGLADYCRDRVRCVRMDLERDDLALAPRDLSVLGAAPIDCFLHCAALTDLRNSPAVAAAARQTNLLGTRRLLTLVGALRVGEFGYVGSAYCCGRAAGTVAPDYVNGHDQFRNPYEQTKLQGEVAVRQGTRCMGLRARYFRLSVVCGRLIEPPLGSISKFGVIYSVGALGARLRSGRRARALQAGPFRACCNPRGGLDLVPADFAAKAIYAVVAQNDPGESYHIVADSSVPNALLVPLLLQSMGVTRYELVEHMPQRKSRLEALCYRSAVGALLPYVRAQAVTFDTRSIRPVLERAGLECPHIDADALRVLIGYAQERNFGLGESAGDAPCTARVA
jgi:nucleoside-diphosphate-sugar epimerase